MKITMKIVKNTMKTIKNKSKAMLNCEMHFNLPIEEILRIKYVDEHKSQFQIAKELNISYPTVIKWLRNAGIYSRKLLL